MSDDDWDAEDAEIVPIPCTAANKFEGEDVDDKAWDASGSDEEPQKVAPPKKKKTLTQKIAEKKKSEELQRREREAHVPESETERKQRLQTSIIEADLEAAKTLFGDLSVSKVPAVGTPLDSSEPKTRAEFESYVKIVIKKFESFESSVQYPMFVESLLREMVVSLSVDDTRKISSALTAMLSEKQKANKATGKKKINKKVTATVMARGVDTTDYGTGNHYDDEFDDFM